MRVMNEVPERQRFVFESLLTTKGTPFWSRRLSTGDILADTLFAWLYKRFLSDVRSTYARVVASPFQNALCTTYRTIEACPT